MGDGLPVLLTGDVFYEKVVDAAAAQAQVEQEKSLRKVVRSERADVLVEWKKQQGLRMIVIEQRRAAWAKEKDDWEAEKVVAKAAGNKFSKKKPVLGKLPPAIPIPPVVVIGDDDEQSDEEEADN